MRSSPEATATPLIIALTTGRMPVPQGTDDDETDGTTPNTKQARQPWMTSPDDASCPSAPKRVTTYSPLMLPKQMAPATRRTLYTSLDFDAPPQTMSPDVNRKRTPLVDSTPPSLPKVG